MGLGSHNCKGEKLGFGHNGVHKKDVEEDDKGKGGDKGKVEKNAFHARAGKHCPLDTRHLSNVHRKNKWECLPRGDGDVVAEEGDRYEKGEGCHGEEDDHNIHDDKDALGGHYVSLENKPVAWLPSALF